MSLFCPVEKSLWLQRVCEANFRKLADLVPDLPSIGHTTSAGVFGKPTLHLRLLDRSPYTLTVELTHNFERDAGSEAAPAVRIRICLDSKTAEVLSDHSRPFVLEALRNDPSADAVLDYKWTLNYFLARWLDHCLSSDYRFGADCEAREPEYLSADSENL